MLATQKPLLRTVESIVFAELEGEAVLLNVETGIYFGLDAIGTDIWQMLESATTEEDIVDRLSREYEVERGQVQSDVAAFLTQLREQGLIVEDTN